MDTRSLAFPSKDIDALGQFLELAARLSPETKAALRTVGQLANSTDLITTGRKTTVDRNGQMDTESGTTDSVPGTLHPSTSGFQEAAGLLLRQKISIQHSVIDKEGLHFHGLTMWISKPGVSDPKFPILLFHPEHWQDYSQPTCLYHPLNSLDVQQNIPKWCYSDVKFRRAQP